MKIRRFLERLGARDGPLLNASAWRFLFGYLKPRGRLMALAVGGATVIPLLALPTLLLLAYAVDQVLPSGDLRLLFLVCTGIVALRLATGVAGLAQRWLITTVVKDAMLDLRGDLIAKVYRLSRENFVQARPASLHARIVTESERADAAATVAMSRIAPGIITALVLGGFLIWLDWRLVLLAVVITPVVPVVNLLTARMVKRRTARFQAAFEAYHRGVGFVLANLDLTRTRGWDEGESGRQADIARKVRNQGHALVMGQSVHENALRGLNNLIAVVILFAGGVAIAKGAMSIGQFVAFFAGANSLNGAISQLTSGLPALIIGDQALTKLSDLMESGPEEPYRGRRRIEFSGEVKLDGVRFDYGERAILDGVNLQIGPGRIVALAGANGSGKSTIISLLLGFYRPETGQLSADGVAYDELDMRSLRRSIGLAPQGAELFDGTVRENIIYGWPDASVEDIELACSRARADSVIARLPRGYETRVGERAIQLSGGERQRLAIARALVGRPRLLILDEPTNHLDAASVAEIMGEIAGRPDGCGVLLVSHDEDVLALADEVYLLKDGKLRPRPKRAKLAAGA